MRGDHTEELYIPTGVNIHQIEAYKKVMINVEKKTTYNEFSTSICFFSNMQAMISKRRPIIKNDTQVSSLFYRSNHGAIK